MKIYCINLMCCWLEIIVFNGIVNFVEVLECEGIMDIEG